MSYAIDLAKRSWQQNKAKVGSKAVGLGSSLLPSALGIAGKIAFNPIGSIGVFGALTGVMTHDPTKNTMGAHMSKEMAKMAADAPMDAAFYGLGTLLGGTAGGLVGIGASIGLSMLGVSPGEMVGHMMDKASQSYNRQKGMGAKSVTQNETTMRATQQGLSMLGQSGRHNMLGQEAQIMHN